MSDKSKNWILAIALTVAFIANSAFAGLFKAYDQENPPVKMDNSEICHDEDSSHYEITKNFTIFGSLEDCLDAGGSLPNE